MAVSNHDRKLQALELLHAPRQCPHTLDSTCHSACASCAGAVVVRLVKAAVADCETFAEVDLAVSNLVAELSLQQCLLVLYSNRLPSPADVAQLSVADCDTSTGYQACIKIAAHLVLMRAAHSAAVGRWWAEDNP